MKYILNYKSGTKWTDWEIDTMKKLMEYHVPQRVIGSIIGRSRKAVERKVYHLRRSNNV